VLATSTAHPRVTNLSLLYGLQNRGEANLIPTWLMRVQRLAEVKSNQSIKGPECVVHDALSGLNHMLLFAVGIKLSLPGRAELNKLGPPALPLGALGRSAPALVGAKALNVSCMTHCHGWITCQLPVTRQA